ILSFNLTGYLIYQFFVDFNAHCYSPFWSINDKRLHNLNYIPSEVNGHWPPHLHFQVISDLLDQKGDFIGVAPKSERDYYLSICPDPNLILGIPSLKPPRS
ncbi:hypothetical protein, partial [Endozoicomonas atrinae]|uniref:hypothetical protein n=1 Tax=Endozoicomonas atrinae TaxID=1333660 RepID=UPI001EE6EAE7